MDERVMIDNLFKEEKKYINKNFTVGHEMCTEKRITLLNIFRLYLSR